VREKSEKSEKSEKREIRRKRREKARDIPAIKISPPITVNTLAPIAETSGYPLFLGQ
jgi:hypothetical protein